MFPSNHLFLSEMSAKSFNLLDRTSISQDPFFQDALSDFDSAMQRTLDKFNHRRENRVSRNLDRQTKKSSGV